MRAAVALRDVVGEGQHVLVVAVVPPQRDLDADAVALALDQDRLVDQRRLGAVEIAHEGFEPALVIELLALGFGMARVGQHDAHAGIEEGEFAQAMLDRRVVELDHGEGFGRRRKVTSVPRFGLPSTTGAGPTTFSGATASPWAKSTTVLQPVAPDAQDERWSRAR